MQPRAISIDTSCLGSKRSDDSALCICVLCVCALLWGVCVSAVWGVCICESLACIIMGIF